MLQFENVSFRYAEDDFDMMRNLNFQVEDREFVSIIGASGCGKSTIFRLINGLEKLQQGRILVDGRPVQELKNYSAFMPQKDLLFPWRTIEKNICLPMELAKVPKAEQEKRCKEVLEQVGLEGYRNKYPKDLSGGMRQRAALIRTLALKPDFLLLDEPFSALDYQTRLDVSDDIAKIIRQSGVTTLLVTHDLSEAISISDRIIVLGKRPGHIRSIITIDFGSEHQLSSKEARIHPQFQNYFNQIWKELKHDE